MLFFIKVSFQFFPVYYRVKYHIRLVLYFSFVYPEDKVSWRVLLPLLVLTSLVLLLVSGVICSSLLAVTHPFSNCVVACCLLGLVPALFLFKRASHPSLFCFTLYGEAQTKKELHSALFESAFGQCRHVNCYPGKGTNEMPSHENRFFTIV